MLTWSGACAFSAISVFITGSKGTDVKNIFQVLEVENLAAKGPGIDLVQAWIADKFPLVVGHVNTRQEQANDQ